MKLNRFNIINADSQPSLKLLLRRIALTVLLGLLLTSCDNEHDKQWAEWRKKTDNIPYRCGMFGQYEFKVDRKYIFFWPNYEGRSDWVVQGPPPISCDAKFSSLSFEAYWPGLFPAGRYPIELDPNAQHIGIKIRSTTKAATWDLRTFLRYKLNSEPDVGTYDTELKLFHFEGVDFSLRSQPKIDFYWVIDVDGVVSNFIECGPLFNGKSRWCKQTQYLPSMQAILDIRFDSSQLVDWKNISRDVIGFINKSSVARGS